MRSASLPFVNEFKDRHGRVRRYVRRHGKAVRLELSPEDPGYVVEYQRALDRLAPVPHASESGTWDALCDEYLTSTRFTQMGARNQVETKREVVRIRAKWGDKPVASLAARHIEKWQDELVDTPGKANNMLSCVKKVLAFGVRRGYRSDNPALGISKLKLGEHRSWTDDELAKFEKKWKVGTRPRLAYALALYTGQRKGDLLTMTWGHIEDEFIRVAQEKTGARLRIPIHPALTDALPPRSTSTARLLPIKSRWFGQIMTQAIRKALGKRSGCVLHGLRKAAARRLAEVGCSAHEIMSITGHRTLSEVQRYTRDAGQLKLANSAMRKLEKGSQEGDEKEGNTQ